MIITYSACAWTEATKEWRHISQFDAESPVNQESREYIFQTGYNFFACKKQASFLNPSQHTIHPYRPWEMRKFAGNIWYY